MGSKFTKQKNTTTMENEITNDSEINSEIDYEFPNYLPVKARNCVVCASVLQPDVRNDPRLSTNLNNVYRNQVSRFQEQIPICSDRFLKGLSVFCEALDIDKSYIDCKKWDVSGEDENFVQYVCCRTCYSRFGQLVTLQELIVTTQVLKPYILHSYT